MAYIGQGIKQGTFKVLDTSGNTYNGSNTTFSLGTQVGAAAQLIVSHDGVIQLPGTDYTLASGGGSITFSTAPASGASIFIIEISGAVGGTVTPSDNSVGVTQLNLSDGSDGQFIKTDGSGTLSFASVSSALDDITTGDAASTLATSAGNITIDAQGNDTDIIFKGTDGGADTTFLTIDGSEGGILKQGTAAQLSSNGSIAQLNNHHASASETAIQTSDGNEKVRCFNDGKVTIEANGSERMRIDSSGKLSTGGETAPDISGGGLCLNIGANDENLISLKSSDIAHGMTNEAETDSFAEFAKQSNSEGGLQIRSYAESRTEEWLEMNCQADSNIQETKAGNAKGAVVFGVNKKSGSGVNTVNSNGNLLTIANYTNTEFIFEANGNFHADSGSTTFDAYEDAQLARAFDLSHGRGVIESKFDKFVQYNHEKLAELKLVGRDEDGTPNSMLNVTGLQRLHNGAIWQQYEKHNQLLEAVYDLAKEAVGEEKANAILEKHEVKRLQ